MLICLHLSSLTYRVYAYFYIVIARGVNDSNNSLAYITNIIIIIIIIIIQAQIIATLRVIKICLKHNCTRIYVY